MVYKWKGNPSESEEMNPKWFDIKKLPFNQMLPDDKYWLPLVLDGKKIKAYFKFIIKRDRGNIKIEEETNVKYIRLH